MKAYNLFFILISIIGMSGCEKDHPVQNYNTDVAHYIMLLKTNQYDSISLPAFTYNDISALLEYRNETQIISDFPRNPISSLWVPDCTLGTYVLWTIESIRSVAINGEQLVFRFPSQNPILSLKYPEELSSVAEEEPQGVAAQAYYNWWYSHTSMNFNEFKNINPLGDTDYSWK
jgi:hypothetical protein